MQKGPKPAELTLSKEEQRGLQELVRKHSTPQQLANEDAWFWGQQKAKETPRWPED